MRRVLLAVAALSIASASHVGAQPFNIVSAFAENFENGLGRWIDREPTDPYAIIVDDPLRPGNRVLGFRRVGVAGTIFSSDLIFSSDSRFTVSFDYLGVGVPGDKGGFFGISQGFPDDHEWVAGDGYYGTPVSLINDGLWHSYTLTFNSQVGTTVHLMFEDYEGAGPDAGDALFDNIQYNDHRVAPAPLFSAVPEPTSFVLMGGGLVGLALVRRRRRAS